MVQLPSTWSNRPFFLSWQSNDSKDTAKEGGGVPDGFFFYSLRPMRHLLPLTTINSWYTVLSLLHSLSLSLSYFLVCVSVCQYLFCRLSRADVRKSEPKLCVTLAVSSYSLTSFSLLRLLFLFVPSAPFLTPHVKRRRNRLVRGFFFSSSTRQLLRLVALTTVLSFKRVACQFVWGRRNTSSPSVSPSLFLVEKIRLVAENSRKFSLQVLIENPVMVNFFF